MPEKNLARTRHRCSRVGMRATRRLSDDLVGKLRELRGGAGGPDSLLIIGSSEASHGTLVTVLDAGAEAELAKIRLAVREEAPGQ